MRLTNSTSRKATIHDVAERAGVSYQTVSRVINNGRYVSAEARQRVLEAIEALDFHPSQMAQGLRKQRSNMIVFLVDGLEHYGPLHTLMDLQNAAKKAGYDLSVIQVDSTSAEQIEHIAGRLRSWSVDGIIAHVITPNDVLGQIQALGVTAPILRVGSSVCLTEDGRVMSVDQYGSQVLTRHLIEIGHTQIAEITGPFSWLHAHRRHQGCLDILTARGLSLLASVEGDWTAESGYQAAEKLVDMNLAFSALIAGNDQMALGAMSLLHARGYSLPQDVSIVGFDNIPEARFYYPSLTTIGLLDSSDGAEKMLERLLHLIENGASDSDEVFLSPKLIVRASTAPPQTQSI